MSLGVDMLQAAVFVIFPFCMVYAAVSDLLSMTIANRVSLLLIASFAILAPLTGMDWATYGWHFAAAALVLCFSFGVFAIGGMGGGDAKLMTATALWFGLDLPLMDYLLTATFIGAFLTVATILFRKSPLSTIHGQNIFLRHLSDEKTGIPYGVALGAAGLLVFPKAPLFVSALAQLTGG
jgi:prepilin peptidase CpaA